MVAVSVCSILLVPVLKLCVRRWQVLGDDLKTGVPVVSSNSVLATILVKAAATFRLSLRTTSGKQGVIRLGRRPTSLTRAVNLAVAM